MDYKKILQEILPGTPMLVGHRGDHLQSDCPFCLHKKHFYINFKRAFEKDGLKYKGSWDCKKCGESGRLPRLLKQLGRLDLIQVDKPVDVAKQLERKINIISEEVLDLEVPNHRPPLGWKRIYDHPYLRERGFTDDDFQKYKIGTTRILSRLKNYIIILIEEDSQCKGYVARSVLSKEELKSINEQIAEYNQTAIEKKRKVLRYANSPNTDFSKLLHGYDEIITGQTHTVILVEGFFDKDNVDRLLELQYLNELKCVVTFGKKISRVQIAKLQRKKILNVIVLYDPDAVNSSKKYSLELERYFNVQVGFLSHKDPGDLSLSELEDVMLNLETPINFNVNKIQRHELE